jgi:hypothetical protein
MSDAEQNSKSVEAVDFSLGKDSEERNEGAQANKDENQSNVKNFNDENKVKNSETVNDEVFLDDKQTIPSTNTLPQQTNVKQSNSTSEINSNSNTNLISCYLCIKVNKNKDFMYCPLNRKMKNKLTSEFWFQIIDNR